MSDFVRMEGDIPITSASAAASLSIEDARFVKSKLHNIEIVSCSDQLWSWVVGLAAVGSISAGLYAMWVEASLIVYIAFVAPLITAPMVLVQRQKLQWMPSKSECWWRHASWLRSDCILKIMLDSRFSGRRKQDAPKGQRHGGKAGTIGY